MSAAPLENSQPGQSATAGCRREAGPTDDRPSTIDESRLAAVRRALESVTDPEIPVLNVLDMGIIADVRVVGDAVEIDVTPTFVGCPAVDVIRDDIRRAVHQTGEKAVTVNVVFDPPWTSDRVTEAGRRRLKEFGLAPPRSAEACAAPAPAAVPCPFCDSANTEMECLFGPTLCRSIHYCRDCRQSFEHFKHV